MTATSGKKHKEGKQLMQQKVLAYLTRQVQELKILGIHLRSIQSLLPPPTGVSIAAHMTVISQIYTSLGPEVLRDLTVNNPMDVYLELYMRSFMGQAVLTPLQFRAIEEMMDIAVVHNIITTAVEYHAKLCENVRNQHPMTDFVMWMLRLSHQEDSQRIVLESIAQYLTQKQLDMTTPLSQEVAEPTEQQMIRIWDVGEHLGVQMQTIVKQGMGGLLLSYMMPLQSLVALTVTKEVQQMVAGHLRLHGERQNLKGIKCVGRTWTPVDLYIERTGILSGKPKSEVDLSMHLSVPMQVIHDRVNGVEKMLYHASCRMSIHEMLADEGTPLYTLLQRLVGHTFRLDLVQRLGLDKFLLDGLDHGSLRDEFQALSHIGVRTIDMLMRLDPWYIRQHLSSEVAQVILLYQDVLKKQ